MPLDQLQVATHRLLISATKEYGYIVNHDLQRKQLTIIEQLLRSLEFHKNHRKSQDYLSPLMNSWLFLPVLPLTASAFLKNYSLTAEIFFSRALFLSLPWSLSRMVEFSFFYEKNELGERGQALGSYI
jgi:hypothetical protein